MDVDSDQIHAASNVDEWLARFSLVAGSKSGTFPFTSHKTQSIESRRARMSDLLIFDVLLIRGGIRSPDMLFPPADWASLRTLLDAIDGSVYDILKKDCLVYILLKWAWDTDPKESNPGWDVRYLQDRCIAPQFAALADAYWLLDTGTHLAKAVSILSDTRLNRDYVSKILQALALSSSPASFASGTAPATARLVVKYVRTAKPLLTEPDDIDLYALSLAQLSFKDAWAYQKSFPDGSNTRERLLGILVSWCLMPTSKSEPLAQLLAFPLSSYEQSFLHTYALPSQFSTSSSLSSVNTHTTSIPSGPTLPSRAMSILQDLLCVRAIQSGDYVRAIKLDRQFSSVSPTLGSGTSPSNIASQATSSGRDTIDRKSIIQALFATLPPAERTLLEDEIGKVATGVRTNTPLMPTPRQGVSVPARRPLMAESSLSASWEDVGASTGSPAPSTLPPSAVGVGFAGKATPAPVSTIGKASQPTFSTPKSASPFASRVPQPSFGHQAPPTPKFTAFGSPIPSSTGVSTTRGVITERAKTLFSTGTMGRPSTVAKPATHISLFDTAGSAKNAPNAFYKPSSALTASTSLDVGSALASSSTAKNTQQATNTARQNGKTQGGESDGENVGMGSGSDVEIIEEDYRDDSGREEEEEAATYKDEDDAGDFLTYDKSGAADLTFHTRHVDEAMNEDHGAGAVLGFSVFSRSRNAVQNGSVGGQGKNGTSGNEHISQVSPSRRARVSPSCDGDKSLSTSIGSAMTSRFRAPPGAFHPEDEEDETRHDESQNEDVIEDEENDHALQSISTQSPRRNTRTRRRSETPPRPSARSQPQRNTKGTTTTTGGTSRLSTRPRRTSSRPTLSIPGSLIDEDNDERGQDDAGHVDTYGDEDAEMNEHEEDDAIAPLPSRSSRRTRRSGTLGGSTKPKSNSKSTAPGKATAIATATKGKAKARPPEPKTPARRSSRLSMASSTSPDHADVASPTKGQKSTDSRTLMAGRSSGAAATRSNARRR